jgi:hypothetical protein
MNEEVNNILRNATLSVAKEQEIVTRVCGKGILYKLIARFSKKTFLEYQICMNIGILKSFDIGIEILENGKKQFIDDPYAIKELDSGILLFVDLKDQWQKNLRRLKVHKNTL